MSCTGISTSYGVNKKITASPTKRDLGSPGDFFFSNFSKGTPSPASSFLDDCPLPPGILPISELTSDLRWNELDCLKQCKSSRKLLL